MLNWSEKASIEEKLWKIIIVFVDLTLGLNGTYEEALYRACMYGIISILQCFQIGYPQEDFIRMVLMITMHMTYFLDYAMAEDGADIIGWCCGSYLNI